MHFKCEFHSFNYLSNIFLFKCLSNGSDINSYELYNGKFVTIIKITIVSDMNDAILTASLRIWTLLPPFYLFEEKREQIRRNPLVSISLGVFK